MNKENRITLDNIINLKKKAETTKVKTKTIQSYYVPNDKSDETLVFESRFESGNLLAVKKISQDDYQLVLQKDTNTQGYTQWFFFRVSNTRKDKVVNMNIINLVYLTNLDEK